MSTNTRQLDGREVKMTQELIELMENANYGNINTSFFYLLFFKLFHDFILIQLDFFSQAVCLV